jgi:protein ImuB
MKPAPAWYACLHVRELPAQALLRLQPALRGQAVAVVEGKAPLEKLCSRNRAAAQMGLVAGMSKVEVESLAAVHVLRRDPGAEAKARASLLNCVAEFTPLAEWLPCDSSTECALVVDLGGSEQLFGTPVEMARRIRLGVQALGLIVEIGLSRNFHTAALLARASAGISFAKEGDEARHLAPLPVTLLPADAQQRETLEAWGIERLGQLAALPEKELVSRMGQPGRQLRLLARGEAPHLLQPIEAPFLLEHTLQLEEPVEQMESLLFCLSPMLDGVIAAARDRALAIAQLNITATLERGISVEDVATLEAGSLYHRVLRPALPTCDRALLLKLVHLDMTAHPPGAGVRALEVSAEAGPISKVQLGLFSPQLPEPGRLQVTLARIAAIVGERRVGWARLEDSHREDDCTLQGFQVKEGKYRAETQVSCTAVRRLRPAAPIAPRLSGRKPQWFFFSGKPYTIHRSFGPWQRSGTWWSGDMWSVEYWDVVAYSPAEELLLGILANDRLHGRWHLEAVYD